MYVSHIKHQISSDRCWCVKLVELSVFDNILFDCRAICLFGLLQFQSNDPSN